MFTEAVGGCLGGCGDVDLPLQDCEKTDTDLGLADWKSGSCF